MHWKLCKVPFFFPVVTAHRDSQPMTKQSWWSTTQPWLLKSSHFSSLELWLGKKESYAALRISLGLLKDNIGGIKRKKRWTCSAKHFLSLSMCLAGSQEAVSEQREKNERMCQVSVSLWLLLAAPQQREKEKEARERKTESESQMSYSNKMHPVQDLFSFSLCHGVLNEAVVT